MSVEMKKRRRRRRKVGVGEEREKKGTDNKWASEKKSNAKRVVWRENEKNSGDTCKWKGYSAAWEKNRDGDLMRDNNVGLNKGKRAETKKENYFSAFTVISAAMLNPSVSIPVPSHGCQQQQLPSHYRSIRKGSMFHFLWMKPCDLSDPSSISQSKYMWACGQQSVCDLEAFCTKHFFWMLHWLYSYVTDSEYNQLQYHLLLRNSDLTC